MSAVSKWQNFWSSRTNAGYGTRAESFYSLHAAELRLLYHPMQPSSVLEVGCGDGALYQHLGFDKARYKGVDFSPGMLGCFRNRYPGVDVVCYDGSRYRDYTQYDLIFSNQVVQHFDRELLRRYLSNARGMMHSDSVLVHGSVPWSRMRRAFYTGACFGRDGRRPILGLLTALRTKLHADQMGHWYDLSDFETLAEDLGMAVSFHGSVTFMYRFHAVMRLL